MGQPDTKDDKHMIATDRAASREASDRTPKACSITGWNGSHETEMTSS